MIDASTQLVAALKTATGLEVYYELFEHPYALPCITYVQYDNSSEAKASNIEYSSIAYYVKLWGKSLSTMVTYANQIDACMRTLGYTRESYNEMAIDTELCMIFQYRGLGKEKL